MPKEVTLTNSIFGYFDVIPNRPLSHLPSKHGLQLTSQLHSFFAPCALRCSPGSPCTPSPWAAWRPTSRSWPRRCSGATTRCTSSRDGVRDNSSMRSPLSERSEKTRAVKKNQQTYSCLFDFFGELVILVGNDSRLQLIIRLKSSLFSIRFLWHQKK